MLRISEGCGNVTMVLHIIRVRAVIQPFAFNLKISCDFTYKVNITFLLFSCVWERVVFYPNTKITKVSVTAKRKNGVFLIWALPSRIPSSIKIAKVSAEINRKDFVFFEFDFAKPHPVLSKYSDLIDTVSILNGIIT